MFTHDIPTVTAETRLAGRGKRLAAFLIDALAFALGLLIAAVVGAIAGRAASMLARLLWSLPLLGVQVWLLAVRGQTVGKILTRIAIVDPETKLPPGFLRASVIRAGPFSILVQFYPLVALLYAVVDSLVIFTPSRRCIHDFLARTEVIDVGRDWR